MRLALDAAGMGSFIWYPDEDRAEADEQLLQLFGLPPDTSINLALALAELIHPDDADRYAEAVGAAIDPSAPDTLDEEIRVVLSDGAVRWVVVTGQATFEGEPPKAMYMAGVATDITARRAASEAEAHLAALVNASQDAIVTVDLDGRFASWNRGAERLFGWSAEEALDQPVSLIVPEDRLDEARLILETKRSEAIPAFDTQRRHRDGSLIDVSVAVSPVLAADGEAIASSAVIRDISSRKQAESEAQAASERAAFLVGLSDAIRPLANPLAVQAEATRLLGEHLGADRAFYAEVTGDGQQLVVDETFHREGAEPLSGTFPVVAFGPSVVARVREGETLVIPDVETYPGLTEAERDAYRSIGVRAGLAIPLIKDGEWVAILSIHQQAARQFSVEEVALVEEVAERTWASVERARAEEALRTSEGQLRAIYDGTSEYIGLVSPDGILLQSNRAALDFHGEPLESVIGKPFWETAWFKHTPGEPERVRKGLEAARKGRLIKREVTLIRPTGEAVTFDFSLHPITNPDGEVVAIVPEGRDISERKRAEEAIRSSEERFRSIANASPIVIWTADADGVISFRNQRWLDYVNDQYNDLGQLWQSRSLHPEDLERCRRAWETAVATGTEYEIEVRHRGHDGSYRWFLSRAVPQVDEAGSVVQWLGTSTDIDDQKRIEDRLRVSEGNERRGRERAETLIDMVSQLETAEGVEERSAKLLDLLVPRIVPYAAISPGGAANGSLIERGNLPEQPSPSYPLGKTGASLRVGLDHASPADQGTELFFRELAQRAGLLLDNARLREEEQKVALRLQRALLPNIVLTHPRVSIAARYESASDVMVVGGDWYDSFTLPDGRIGLAVGDVVGHGLEAAAAMGRMRIALAAIAPESSSPSALLEKLDEFAGGPNGAEFTTLCYAILDPETGQVEYASAGHPPILVVDPEGETTWLEEGRSTPLGWNGPVQRSHASFELSPGSLMVLYSDGLIERRRESLNVGMRRLESSARNAMQRAEWDACDVLVRDLGVDRDREDDVVVMCVRFTPAPLKRFHRRFPASADQLAPLRSEIRRWLESIGAGKSMETDLLLAVGEASSNSIEHAYLDGVTGDIDVEAIEDESGSISVRVRDFGTWRTQEVADKVRGRGTGIIKALVEDFSRQSSTGGTTVTFRIPKPVGALL